MLSRVREILLTQYIGSILIALLGCQALVVLVTTVVRTATQYVDQQHNQSVLVLSTVRFDWNTVILAAVTIALYLFTAYLLARWLYPKAQPPSAPHSEGDQS